MTIIRLYRIKRLVVANIVRVVDMPSSGLDPVVRQFGTGFTIAYCRAYVHVVHTMGMDIGSQSMVFTFTMFDIENSAKTWVERAQLYLPEFFKEFGEECRVTVEEPNKPVVIEAVKK